MQGNNSESTCIYLLASNRKLKWLKQAFEELLPCVTRSREVG